MKKENSPELNRVFEVLEQGQTPDLMEMLAALNEISDHNVPQSPQFDGSSCPKSSNCLDCG